MCVPFSGGGFFAASHAKQRKKSSSQCHPTQAEKTRQKKKKRASPGKYEIQVKQRWKRQKTSIKFTNHPNQNKETAEK